MWVIKIWAHSIVLFLIVGRRIFPKQNKWQQHQVQYLVSNNFLIDNFHVSSIRSVTPPLSGINSWANPCFEILRIRCWLNFWIFEVISTIYYRVKRFFYKMAIFYHLDNGKWVMFMLNSTLSYVYKNLFSWLYICTLYMLAKMCTMKKICQLLLIIPPL